MKLKKRYQCMLSIILYIIVIISFINIINIAIHKQHEADYKKCIEYNEHYNANLNCGK